MGIFWSLLFPLTPVYKTDSFPSLSSYFHIFLSNSQLVKSLMEPFQSSKSSAEILHRQSYHSVARCVAALSSASPKDTAGTVTSLIQQVCECLCACTCQHIYKGPFTENPIKSIFDFLLHLLKTCRYFTKQFYCFHYLKAGLSRVYCRINLLLLLCGNVLTSTCMDGSVQ